MLLHGIGSTKDCWRPVLPLLTARHEVVRFDMPGFGDSPFPADGREPSPDALADVIAAELGRLGLDRPQLVGNSLGGEVALDLARRGLARSVVALSPSGLSTSVERELIVASLGFGHFTSRSLAPFADTLARSPAFRTLAFAQLHARPWQKSPAQSAADVRNTARPYYLRCLKAVEARSAIEWLGQVEVPVLIAFGVHDRVLGAHQGPRFLEALPDARLERLPGAGHVPMSDAPELVARTILAFTDSS